MDKWTRTLPLALSLALGAACADNLDLEGAEDEAALDQHSVNNGSQLSGAIFTTTFNGSVVNENVNYADKCDVYLNGGPGKDGSAGLPEGDYYFQVTDPGGKVLLSQDQLGPFGVFARQFHIGPLGQITGVSGQGNHDDTNTNTVDGGQTIQLCPYLNTPNPGCEYKVWVTPVGKFVTNNGSTFGFTNNWSKTDNFKICKEDELPPPCPAS